MQSNRTLIPDKLTFKVEEARQLLGRGQSQFYEDIRSGKIPIVGGGGRKLIARHTLFELLGIEDHLFCNKQAPDNSANDIRRIWLEAEIVCTKAKLEYLEKELKGGEGKTETSKDEAMHLQFKKKRAAL
jgi:hypothetical protein